MLLALAALAPASEVRWNGLAPVSADLVYAAPTATGSAGMFGHILIRIRGGNGEVAVGYAADLGNDRPLQLAWRGLTGAYTATYTIQPWQRELRGYQVSEGRPVWIYPLRLDPAGLDRLLTRIADIQGAPNDYYLLGGNCADGIADLLEVAAPSAGVRQQLGVCTSPAGVVRAAHHSHLIDDGTRLPGPGSDRFAPTADAPAGRITLGGGYDGEEGFTSLAWRPAWHAQDDARGTIALGDALETLTIEARWQMQAERLALHRLTLLAVESFAQPIAHPAGLAWQAELGSRRERRGSSGLPDQQVSLAGGMGASCAVHADAVLWLTGCVDVRLVDDISMPAAGGGLAGGMIADLGPCVASLRGRALLWSGQTEARECSASIALSAPLGRSCGVGLASTWREAWGWRAGDVVASWRLYF